MNEANEILNLEAGLVTDNPGVMAGFYRNVFGFTQGQTVELPDGAVLYKLNCGDLKVKLLRPAGPPPAEARPGKFTEALGLRYLCLQVRSLEGVAERAREAGAEFIVEPHTVRPGVQAALLLDPDGNTLELMQYDGV